MKGIGFENEKYLAEKKGGKHHFWSYRSKVVIGPIIPGYVPVNGENLPDGS